MYRTATRHREPRLSQPNLSVEDVAWLPDPGTPALDHRLDARDRAAGPSSPGALHTATAFRSPRRTNGKGLSRNHLQRRESAAPRPGAFSLVLSSCKQRSSRAMLGSGGLETAPEDHDPFEIHVQEPAAPITGDHYVSEAAPSDEREPSSKSFVVPRAPRERRFRHRPKASFVLVPACLAETLRFLRLRNDSIEPPETIFRSLESSLYSSLQGSRASQKGAGPPEKACNPRE